MPKAIAPSNLIHFKINLQFSPTFKDVATNLCNITVISKQSHLYRNTEYLLKEFTPPQAVSPKI